MTYTTRPMTYTTRPLSDRTWLIPRERTRSRFTASWSDTLDLLGREVRLLDGRDLVIEVDVREQDIRLDGQLRANAVAQDPAVVLAMDTRHGPLLYRCDQHDQLPWGAARNGTAPKVWMHTAPKVWMHNVRAIALTLEALRAIDRYGATDTGQQYTGFKALPAGRAMPASHLTTEQAYDVLCAVLDLRDVADLDTEDAVLVRRAKAAAHPDRHGGDRTLWDQVEQAGKVLGVDRG